MRTFRKKLNKLFTLPHSARFKLFSQLQQLQSTDLETVQSMQLSYLNSLLNHAYHHTSYYKKTLDRYGLARNGHIQLQAITDLQQLPLLTKEHITTSFPSLCASDHSKRGSYLDFSGGSTGVPTKFLHDKHYHDHCVAHTFLVHSWRNVDIFDSQYYIWGAPRDMNNGIVGTIKNKIRNRSYFNCFTLTEETMAHCIQELNHKKPSLIIAYANAIYDIALFAKKHQIHVEPQQAIHTGAGTLFEFMKDTIQSCFNCNVFNHYGGREVGPIASECIAQKGLHLLPLNNIVEVLDDNNQPVPEGVEGNIVVTSLHNYAMPFIRYSIGDRGILSSDKHCRCGCVFPKLHQVTGRESDRVLTPDNRAIDSNYFIHAIGVNGNKNGAIKQFQIVQHKKEAISLNIVPQSDPTYVDIDTIRTDIEKTIGHNCTLNIFFVDSIEKSPTGKYRYVVRHF